MVYVYVLFSEKDNKLYVGYTGDLKARLQRHKRGLVKSTKYRLPLRLIYYEAYLLDSDARRREIYLKGGKGKSELKVQLKAVFTKVGYFQHDLS